jgi:alginate O-acetyltransferase complex protein AlgI
MLFNSYVFLFAFLPLALALWWLPRRLEVRLGLLVAASYVFYGWWDWRFCALMALTTVADYVAARQIAALSDPLARKRWLIGVVALNLSLLGYFKYAGFFTESINDAAQQLGAGNLVPLLSVVLPLGISFYTFESLSYTIDVYRGIARPARSFLHYALFISIFPKLIAGPIIRYTDVEAQYATLELRPRIDPAQMWKGIVFFVVGLAKKVLIADSIAGAAALLGQPDHPTFTQSWAIVAAYTLQIYFDFSGYSDMAVGLGYMLGFDFPRNFDRPYLARNISEFWERWHITFSRFLRDYLFIPLGGSRRGLLITVRNLLIVMVLGGLWHGASWTFVLWGVYHGTLLGAYHGWRRLRAGARTLPVWPARAVTLLAVMVGWALFLSPDVSAARELLGGMAGAHGFGTLGALRQIAEPSFLLGALWVLLVPEVWDWKLPARRYWAVAAAAVLVACIGQLSSYSPFIYFQF